MAKISPENVRFSVQLAIMVVSWLLTNQANQNSIKQELKDQINELITKQEVQETRLVALEKQMDDQKSESRDLRTLIDLNAYIPESPSFQSKTKKR